jgi:hypothetical protein
MKYTLLNIYFEQTTCPTEVIININWHSSYFFLYNLVSDLISGDTIQVTYH